MLLLQGVTANVVLVKPMVVEVCVGEYNSDPCMKLAVGMFVAGFVADAVAVDFEHRWCMAVVVAVAVVVVDVPCFELWPLLVVIGLLGVGS